MNYCIIDALVKSIKHETLMCGKLKGMFAEGAEGELLKVYSSSIFCKDMMEELVTCRLGALLLSKFSGYK